MPSTKKFKTPESEAEWKLFEENRKNRKALTKSLNLKDIKQAIDAREEKKPKRKDFVPGANVYLVDYYNDNWLDDDIEWTADSITGFKSTFNNDYFQQHISGFRLHADYDNTYVNIEDGSSPLQTWSTDARTIAGKFYWNIEYYSVQDTPFDHLDISILAVDSTNAATKTRLDFYRDFGSGAVLAIQVMVETTDEMSHREMRVRFNLTQDQIDDAGATSNVNIEASRIPLSTVRAFDREQSYDWNLSEYGFFDTVYYDDLGFENFKGVSFYRRVPYTALTLSNFFPEVSASVNSTTTTMTNTTTSKSSNLTWVTFGLVVLLFAIVAMQFLFARKLY